MSARLFAILTLAVSLVSSGMAGNEPPSEVADIAKAISPDALPWRVALVIGNAKYGSDVFADSVVGAHDVAEELRRDGFDVEVDENLGGEAMRWALQRFYGRITPDTFAVIFFSGLGLQSNGQSYLMPVDVRISVEADVPREGLSLASILAAMNNRDAKLKVVLLDAARKSTIEPRFRNYFAGLALPVAPPETLTLYSASSNMIIDNEGAGDHRLFVGELLKEIGVPNRPAEYALLRTRANIARATKGNQVPWLSSAATREISFNPGLHPLLEAPALGQDTPKPTVQYIGVATMSVDRTITLEMRLTGDGQPAQAEFYYKVGDKGYDNILQHLEGINPGESKPLKPFR
jgi:Caspase domain